MKSKVIDIDLPVVVFDDFYDKHELKLIHQELDFLKRRLKLPNDTGTAYEGNRELKSNRGIWLDTTYSERTTSNILSINRKLFSENVRDTLAAAHSLWKHYAFCDADATLVSLYQNNDFYEPHVDNCLFTSLSWLSVDEFTGGDFKLVDYNETIEFKDNRVVFI